MSVVCSKFHHYSNHRNTVNCKNVILAFANNLDLSVIKIRIEPCIHFNQIFVLLKDFNSLMCSRPSGQHHCAISNNTVITIHSALVFTGEH